MKKLSEGLNKAERDILYGLLRNGQNLGFKPCRLVLRNIKWNTEKGRTAYQFDFYKRCLTNPQIPVTIEITTINETVDFNLIDKKLGMRIENYGERHLST